MSKEEHKQNKVNGKSLPLRIITVSLRVPILLLILLIILTFFGSSMFLSRYPNALSFMGVTLNPQLMAQQRNEQILSEVGTLMNLPSDEQPTMATVTDVELVKDQVFFKDAENGDVVLIYANARKAILFRPDENRIIEVGALNINQDQAGVAGNETQVDDEDNEEEPEEDESASAEEPSPTSEPTETPTPEPTETSVEEEVSE